MLAKQNSQYFSMPDLERARTPLRVFAKLGLSNFQLLLYVLVVVYIMQMADGAMLPGVFKALEEGLGGVTPMSLAFIALSEAVVHSISIVIWGILADRRDKLELLKYATLAFALTTLATACVQSIVSLAIVRIVAGVVSASLVPLVQGVVGSACPAKGRGSAFGLIIAFGEFGRVLGLMMGGSLSHIRVIGDWRGAFVIMSVLTLLVSWILHMVQEEVRYGLFCESRTWALLEDLQILDNIEQKTVFEILGTVWHDFVSIVKRPSFLVLMLQGIFACTALRALSYQTMWGQYLGFNDVKASSISASFPFGCICGAYLSGKLSDIVARHYQDHGRILFGQSANLMSLLVFFLIYTTSSNTTLANAGLFWKMNLLNFLSGLFSIVSYAAVVKPIYVDIVPPNLIAQVVAMAAAVDGVTSSFISMPLVAYIAGHFGYKNTDAPMVAIPLVVKETNARAFGLAMSAVTMGSTILLIITFSLLHLTYPRDRNLSMREEDDLAKL